MQRFFSTILALLISTISFAQTATELNEQAKSLLAKQDFKNAVPIIQKAAEKGNAEAQYNLGICYQQGVEMQQSDSLANSWFLKSATQGWKDAQYKIAYSFATGRGGAKDDKMAFYWSVKCAQQRDLDCIFNVVDCYLTGRGTDKNLDSMLTWATRLALMDNPQDLNLSGQITSARANLAIMYRDGQNVGKDYTRSYMWFLIYNESKRDFSVAVQQKNIESIQNIEKQLSQADKDKAIKQAEELLNKKLNNLANLYKQDL